MGLVILDQVIKQVPSSVSVIYSTWPRLKDLTRPFCAQLTENHESRGLLYIGQREYAVTVPQDENVLTLGTDDCTTSVMAVLRHTGEYNFFPSKP